METGEQLVTPIKLPKRKYESITTSNVSPSTNSICSINSYNVYNSSPNSKRLVSSNDHNNILSNSNMVSPAIVLAQTIQTKFSFNRENQAKGLTHWGNQLGSPSTISYSGYTLDWLQQAFRACIFYKSFVSALLVILEVLSFQELPEFQHKSDGSNGHEPPAAKNIIANFKHFIIDHLFPYISHKDSWFNISLIYGELAKWDISDLNRNYILCYNIVTLLNDCAYNTFCINLTCWSQTEQVNISKLDSDEKTAVDYVRNYTNLDYEVIPIALNNRSKSLLYFIYYMLLHSDKAIIFALDFLGDYEQDITNQFEEIFNEYILSEFIKEDIATYKDLSRFDDEDKYRIELNNLTTKLEERSPSPNQKPYKVKKRMFSSTIKTALNTEEDFRNFLAMDKNIQEYPLTIKFMNELSFTKGTIINHRRYENPKRSMAVVSKKSPLYKYAKKRFLQTKLEDLKEKFQSRIYLIKEKCKEVIKKSKSQSLKNVQFNNLEEFLNAVNYDVITHFFNAINTIIHLDYSADSKILSEMNLVSKSFKHLYEQAQSRIKDSTATKNKIKTEPIIVQKQQQKFFITQLIKIVQLSTYLVCSSLTSNKIRSEIYSQRAKINLIENITTKENEIEHSILNTIRGNFPFNEINDLITKYKLELVDDEKFSFMDKRFHQMEPNEKIYYNARQIMNKVCKKRKQLQHYKPKCILCIDELNKTNDNMIHFYGNVYFCVTCKTNLDKIRQSMKQCKQCQAYIHLEMDEFRSFHANLCYSCYYSNLQDVENVTRSEERYNNIDTINFLQGDNIRLMEEAKLQDNPQDSVIYNQRINVNNEIINQIKTCMQNDALESDSENEMEEEVLDTQEINTLVKPLLKRCYPPLPMIQEQEEFKSPDLRISNDELDFTLGREEIEPLFPDFSVNTDGIDQFVETLDSQEIFSDNMQDFIL